MEKLSTVTSPLMTRGMLLLALLAAACGKGMAFSPALPSLRAYGPSCGTGVRLAFPQVVPPPPERSRAQLAAA